MNRLVVSCTARVFKVDISEKACSKFGFKHGDRIRVNIQGDFLGEATVIGVAPAAGCSNPQSDVLWIALDKHNGRVNYARPSTIKNCFTLIPN